MPAPSQASKVELQSAIRKVADQYLKDPNVSSVGLGYRVKDGVQTEELTLQFTVDAKAAPEALPGMQTAKIPERMEVNGITFTTDVVERSFSKDAQVMPVNTKSERKRRLDPIAPGTSIGHTQVSAGTLGCLVREVASGELRVLSNWHVLQGEHGALGDLIVQPAPHDDNRIAANACGRLVRSHLGLAGDCAIASIEHRSATEAAFELGTTVRQIGDPDLGDRVVKSSRTTGVTYGIVTRLHTITKITYGGAGPQQIGGFEIGPDPERVAPSGEISQGGDSGAAWMAVEDGTPTELMLGLHFAGETTEPAEFALASYASSVFEKLEIEPLQAPAIAPAMPAAAILETTPGYTASFLPGHDVALPRAATPGVETDYAPTKAGALVRDYTHFSLAMSRERRFCRWVAWNVDGGALRKNSRNGLSFKLDDAYDPAFQIGEDLYAGNRLDRGHVARRADLVWGSPEEAQRANVDSFFFTNITPQLDDFNQSGKQGLWGELENAIFEDVSVDSLRLTVFGGPIFKDTDLVYRGVAIPRSFWKLICFVESGALRAKAFVLTQDDLEAKLESLGLEEFQLFQVSLPDLTARTGLAFDDLLTADTLRAGVESVAGEQPILRIERRSQIGA